MVMGKIMGNNNSEHLQSAFLGQSRVLKFCAFSPLVLDTLCPGRCPSPAKAGQLRLAERFSTLPVDTQLTD